MPSKILDRLRGGSSVAAEVVPQQTGTRAFVMIIPKETNSSYRSETRLNRDDQSTDHTPGSESAKTVTKYEIRYLEHDAKYTDEMWGWDYDLVLDDKTTRIKRVFVEREQDVEEIVMKWLQDFSLLQSPEQFDSSLVNSPIDSYLDKQNERPHLWQ